MLSVDQFYNQLPPIALFAKTRSGKDEVYNILKEIGFNVERVAFGDYMKEKFFELFPEIPKDPKPTAKLIQFGEGLRQIDPYVFVRPTMNRMELRKRILEQASLPTPSFVVTDVRNFYEYNACREAGMIMVRVEASEEVRVQRMLKLGEEVSREVLDAPTEKTLESFLPHYVIVNNSTKEQLAQEVTEFVYKVQKRRANRFG